MYSMWLSAKNNLVVLPTVCKKLIFLNAAFHGGRLFVGAICVLYFLSFGLETEDYIWIKSIQVIIFIGLDIPLGYVLNRIGEYNSLLLSLILGVIGALGYLLSSSFFGFLLSEVFLALSISIWPVALSAYSMKILQDYKIQGLTEKFFHLGDAISKISVLICGSLGGLLYVFDKHIPYSLFVILYVLAMIFAWLFLKDYKDIPIKKKKSESFSIRELKPILSFVFLLMLAQFFMQPLLHFWQPLFEERFKMSSEDFSIVFISYSLAMSTFSWTYSKITHHSILCSNLFVPVAAVIGGVSYSFIGLVQGFSSSSIFLSGTFGIFNLVQIAWGILIQNKLPQNKRMIITKYVAFISRIGMIISLIFLHALFANGWKTNEIYKLYGSLSIFFYGLYLTWAIIQNYKEKNYESLSTS